MSEDMPDKKSDTVECVKICQMECHIGRQHIFQMKCPIDCRLCRLSDRMPESVSGRNAGKKGKINVNVR